MNYLYRLLIILISFLSISCQQEITHSQAHIDKQTTELETTNINDPLPNIIIILADDLGYGDIGAYNKDSKIPTPNIDLLANHGVVFTDAHSPSAVCTPTRYSVLTGEYSWRTWLKKGVLKGHDRSLINTGKPTIASLLKKQGYSTAAIGKWHLGFGTEGANFETAPDIRPTTLGFDYFYGISSSLDIPPYGYIENGVYEEPLIEKVEDKRAGAELDGFQYWREGLKSGSFDFYKTDQVLMDKAIQYIGEQKQKESPFFLYLPLTAPHTPLVPRKEYEGSSQAGVYGDFVAQTDASIGRLMNHLSEIGELENTILIMTSDNGAVSYSYLRKLGHSPNGNWRGMKSQLYEGGHRIPLIVHWPEKIRKNISHQFVSLVDFYATFSELIGAEIPEGQAIDSYSFADQLIEVKNNNLPRRENILSHSLYGTFAIRVGQWKMILDDESGGFGDSEQPDGGVFWYGEPLKHSREQWQLYNLSTDPGETNNVLIQNPDVVERLSAVLDDIKDK